jgi:hypothetical protein
MATLRNPGVICQISDWYEDIEDGTLARMPSPLPSVVGAPGSGGAAQAGSRVVTSGACSFLNPRLTGTVRAPQEAFDQLRAKSGDARISSAQPIASHTWPDRSSSAAVEQQVQIDGRTIRVVRPTEADAAGKNLPTTAQVSEALRAIPADQRAHTKTLIISPRPHPDSTPSRTIAGEAGSGEIGLFPVNRPQSQNDFDNRLTHESGHNYQGSLWQSAQAVQEWKMAAVADDRLPSPYAGENAGDDFCEFNVLYNTARGTHCEATARQLYPNRWQKMLDYHSK